MPIEHSLFRAKIDTAISLLRPLAGKDYTIAYSGGKDSDAILELATLAGLDRPPVYHVTTIDPPEIVYHCRERRAYFDHPGRSFFSEVTKHGLPTRWRRWCCRDFKHSRRDTLHTILGVRAAESPARRTRWRRVQETPEGYIWCPIIDWSTDDVWRFLDERKCGHCTLYDEGFTRIGCIGCCLSRGARLRDFPRWPKIATLIQDAYFRCPRATPQFWHDWLNDIHHTGPELPCTAQLDLWS